MERSILHLAVAIAIATLQGCGGGGGDNSSSSASSNTSSNGGNYTLSGQVPGTFIEAYCDDGSYASTYSQQNGTQQHPFQLQLPANTYCQLVMTMNEADPANKTVSTVAVDDGTGPKRGIRAHQPGENIDIGFVDLPRDRSQIIDNDGDGIHDLPVTVTLTGLEKKKMELLDHASRADIDGDGIPNYYDKDMDGDGIPNSEDSDRNGDGVDDRAKPDSDGDGIADNEDRHNGFENSAAAHHGTNQQTEGNNGFENSVEALYGTDHEAQEHQGSDHEAAENNGFENGENGFFGGSTSFSQPVPISGSLPQITTFQKDDGRLLAAQCAQCHGTFGCSQSGFPGLLGEAGEIYSHMIKWQGRSNINDDIMVAQSKGYTAQQANLIQQYYTQLPGQVSLTNCRAGD